MHDAHAWSLNLGRWGAVRVRLHVLYLLVGVFALYLGSRDPDRDVIWYVALGLLILFVSVFLHELAHCIAALRCDGQADEIIIGPFGGLAPVQIPHEPHCQLLVALAGPAMNFAIFAATAPLIWWTGSGDLVGLLNPLHPAGLLEPTLGVVFLKLTCFFNWILLLLNLLPAFPFDGGQALRAMLWPSLGYKHAAVVVGRVAKFVAVLLWIVAWYTHDPEQAGIVQPWLPLVLLGVFLFFSAKQEEGRQRNAEGAEDLFGYDFSQGYTSLERSEPEPPVPAEPGMLRRWLQQRREERERQLREREAAEEERVDEILAQLHVKGLSGLSPEDRAILERVSARLRERMKQ